VAQKASLQVSQDMLLFQCSLTCCVQFVTGLFLFSAVTVEGKIYACGEATNGRLGLGLSSGTIPIPRQITALSNYVVKKVAVHSGGRHAMALTVDGKVFSWGEGDDGKLGHFSRMCVLLHKYYSHIRSVRGDYQWIYFGLNNVESTIWKRVKMA